MFLAGLLAETPAFAARWWKLALGIVLGFALCWPVASCSGRKEGRADLLAEQQAEALRNTNRADQAEQARREAAQNRADAVEGALNNAIQSNPETTNRAAGPASSDVLGELRRRRGN